VNAHAPKSVPQLRVQPLFGEANYLNAEVEPWVAANPRTPALDWSLAAGSLAFGGRSRPAHGVSHDAGESWAERLPIHHLLGRQGFQQRETTSVASRPMGHHLPNAVAHQIALSFDFIPTPTRRS